MTRPLDAEHLEAAAGQLPGAGRSAEIMATRVIRAYLGDAVVIRRDENGEWPEWAKTPLNSWAHRWPAMTAHNILEHLYDLQNMVGGLDALVWEEQ